MAMAVSAATAAVTLINILNCHSCLVWSMDNPAEPMVWSSMNGPRPGWEEVSRAGWGREREERRDAHRAGRSYPGQAVRSKIIMTWQIINKHSRVISKAKLMNSFQVFYSQPKKIFYCILICIELADRPTNNNTKWIKDSSTSNMLFKTGIFLPVLLGRIKPTF